LELNEFEGSFQVHVLGYIYKFESPSWKIFSLGENWGDRDLYL